MPAIPVPPTQKNVIQEIINRAMRCKSELQLEYIFLEVDQAIYNKVLLVLFNQKARDPSFCIKLIVRIGGFHIVLCLLKTINSRFYNSGIVELLVEAGVGSEGIIRSVMKGSDVKFGIRCYKILFEAILRTKIEFIMENVVEFSELPLLNNLKIANLCNEVVCPEKVESIINDVDIVPTLDGDMSKWMDSLLSMIDLLLNLIFFQHTCNWKGYLEAIHTFLPWHFALNRHNYARKLSYFYVDKC